MTVMGCEMLLSGAGSGFLFAFVDAAYVCGREIIYMGVVLSDKINYIDKSFSLIDRCERMHSPERVGSVGGTP